MATSAVLWTGFDNGVLVRSVDLMTADQIRMVIGKEAKDVLGDWRILVGWQADGTFQSESCHKMSTEFSINPTICYIWRRKKEEKGVLFVETCFFILCAKGTQRKREVCDVTPWLTNRVGSWVKTPLKTGRSFKDKLSVSNSLALSRDAKSGGADDDHADSEDAHFFFFVVYLGTVGRLTIRPLSHLYLFWGPAVGSYPILSPSTILAPLRRSWYMLLYTLHIVDCYCWRQRPVAT